jgi:hypothetical protein
MVTTTPRGGWRLLIATTVFGVSLFAAGNRVALAGSGSSLPLSPHSAGLLVAAAVHAGRLSPQQGGPPQITCSPAPCLFPNDQASEGGQPVNEDPIAANPANSQQLLSGGNDYNCSVSIQGFYTSGDGGSTWHHTCKTTMPGFIGCGDPVVGYDLTGTAYIGGIESTNGVTCTPGLITLEKSTNNGATWSAPAEAVPPLFSGGISDKPWMQIDTSPTSPHANTIYISATQFNAASTKDTISVSHSSDGGAHWTLKQVDTTQNFPATDQFSDIAIGKDGTVYVTFYRCNANGPTGDCGGTTATLFITKSTDGGDTWSAPAKIASVKQTPDSCGAFYGCIPNTLERVNDIPVVGIDNSTDSFAGGLYVVVYNYTGVFMQVLVTTSADGGTTWSKPAPVAPASDTHDQFFPWLSVSATGTVGVTWLDRRNDPSNVNYEAFGTLSTTGGASFTTDHQLASKPSNPNNDGFGGVFMGDYAGNTWDGNALYGSWMDSRNGVDMQDEVGGGLTH